MENQLGGILGQLLQLNPAMFTGTNNSSGQLGYTPFGSFYNQSQFNPIGWLMHFLSQQGGQTMPSTQQGQTMPGMQQTPTIPSQGSQLPPNVPAFSGGMFGGPMSGGNFSGLGNYNPTYTQIPGR